MRKTPLALVLAMAACSPPSHRGDEGTPPLQPGHRLAGAELERVHDGDWTVRRTETAGGKSFLAGSSRARDEYAGGRPTGPGAPPTATGAVGGPATPGPASGVAGGGGPGAGCPVPVTAGPGMPTGGGGRHRVAALTNVTELVAADRRVAATAPEPSLRAGSTDDNADLDAFAKFVAGRTHDWKPSEAYDLLDVRRRVWLRVVDQNGAPIPAAEVHVIDTTNDAVVARATTYGDGRAPFYPADRPSAGQSPSYLVEVRAGDERISRTWNGEGDELELKVGDTVSTADPVRLDVAIVLDTTGSMGDEIARIKSSLLSVTRQLRSLEREFDLRYGAVLYRDIGDQYVTKMHPFTSDIEAFDRALKDVQAGGGGDGPESLNQGLAVAIGDLDWRPGAARVAFLIADAPPHMDYEGDVRYGASARAALARGIRIHTVAASGLDAIGTLVFRQIAQYTRGKFVFIQYGTLQASAQAHGVTGDVEGNNLDTILFEQIRDEVAGWGRDKHRG